MSEAAPRERGGGELIGGYALVAWDQVSVSPTEKRGIGGELRALKIEERRGGVSGAWGGLREIGGPLRLGDCRLRRRRPQGRFFTA